MQQTQPMQSSCWVLGVTDAFFLLGVNAIGVIFSFAQNKQV
jgi:hypothetical protein